VAAVLALVLAGCWEQVDRHWFSQMKEQPAVQAHEEAPRLPPEHTVPAGGIVPRLVYAPSDPQANNPMMDASVTELANPVEATPESITRGGQLYAVQCAVCHGRDGTNPMEAPVSQKLVQFGVVPLPLASTAAYTDGQIFTKIRYGKPYMPAYPQIAEVDRWHIVNYLRTLFPRMPRGG
jgi:mono/diheme cytochrome c family protein